MLLYISYMVFSNNKLFVLFFFPKKRLTFRDILFCRIFVRFFSVVWFLGIYYGHRHFELFLRNEITDTLFGARYGKQRGMIRLPT